MGFFNPDNGSLAEWVAAAAAIIGGGWALFLYHRSQRTLKRSQATMVFCRYDAKEKEVEVVNLSAMPITDIQLFATKPASNLPGFPKWLAPGGSHGENIDLTGRTSYRVDVQFLDHSGQRWRRSSSGKLETL